MNTQTLPQPPASVNGHLLSPPYNAPVPEALCSMNGYVKIGLAETRNHQVTGRGNTPEEAAANYFGGVEALEAGYAARAARNATPAPLASRTQRLSLLLACGVEKAIGKGDWKLVERLMKAVVLVLAERVVQTGDGTCQVRSQTEPETTVYRVQGRACACQDASQHHTDVSYWCKHSLSSLMEMKLKEQEVCNGR